MAERSHVLLSAKGTRPGGAGAARGTMQQGSRQQASSPAMCPRAHISSAVASAQPGCCFSTSTKPRTTEYIQWRLPRRVLQGRNRGRRPRRWVGGSRAGAGGVHGGAGRAAAWSLASRPGCAHGSGRRAAPGAGPSRNSSAPIERGVTGEHEQARDSRVGIRPRPRLPHGLPAMHPAGAQQQARGGVLQRAGVQACGGHQGAAAG